MENAVSESDRLSGIDENVCNLHANIWNMVLGIDKNTRLCLYMLTLQTWLTLRSLGGFVALDKVGRSS